MFDSPLFLPPQPHHLPFAKYPLGPQIVAVFRNHQNFYILGCELTLTNPDAGGYERVRSERNRSRLHVIGHFGRDKCGQEQMVQLGEGLFILSRAPE